MGASAGPSLQGIGRGGDSGLVFSLDATMLAGTSDLPIKNGLEVWLDGADDDTFAYGTGTDVTRWSDKSGNGNDVVQTTAANMPTRIPYTTVTANPCSVVDFNGSTDSLSSTTTVDLATPGVYTQIVVWSCDVASGDAGLISINNNLSSGITSHAGNSVYRYYGSGGYNLATYSLSTGNFYITGKVFPGAGGSVTKVGFQDGTKATSVGATGVGHASGVLRLGQQSTYFNGKIAEVIIYTRALSDAEMAQIHTYLNQKWNINVSDAGWYDLSGNGINGTMEDNAQYDYVTGFSSRAGGSVSWDGTDDYVDMDNITLGTGDLTFTSWFRCASVNTDALIAFSTGSYALGLYTYYTGPPYTVWFCPSTSPTGASSYVVKGKTAIKAGLWYYLVGTRRGSELAIYVNGELENTLTSPAPYNMTSYGPSIGRMRSGQHVLHGNIAKTQIYNRALTAEEVKVNFNMFANRLSGSGLYGTHYEYIGWTLKGIVKDNLTLYLDAADPGSYQGEVVTWYDLINGYDGTISNATYDAADSGSLSFDGSGDTVDVGPITTAGEHSSCTISIWMNKAAQVSTYGNLYDCNYGITDYNKGPRMEVDYHGSIVRVYMGTDGGSYTSISFGSLSNSVWYNLVLTVTPNGPNMDLKSYVDGVLYTSSTPTGTTWDGDVGDLYLGVGFTAGRHFTGKIAAFALYDRVLAANEIVQNFQVQRARFGK